MSDCPLCGTPEVPNKAGFPVCPPTVGCGGVFVINDFEDEVSVVDVTPPDAPAGTFAFVAGDPA